MTTVAVRTQGASVFVVFFMAAVAGGVGILEARVAMAFLAGKYGVLADERKSRDVMIETADLLPAVFIVALLAMFTLLAGVNIISHMAAQAVGLEFVFMHITLMTGITLQFCVLAPEGELSIPVVREGAFFPAVRGVALLALLTVLAFVYVIGFVTAETGLLRFDFIDIGAAGMTTIAACLFMSPL